MKLRNFNLIASASAFLLGAVYVLSDGASINANVIGASGGSAGLAAIIGMFMIIGAIGLFIVSMHSSENHTIDLERMIRRGKHHEELSGEHSEEELHTRKSP
jgi:hypothetical protein